MRALAPPPPPHPCVPGSTPGPGVIYGLSLLLVLYSALRGLFSGFSGFPRSSVKNQHFQIPIRSWNALAFLNEFLWTPWCSVGKQSTYLHTYYTFPYETADLTIVSRMPFSLPLLSSCIVALFCCSVPSQRAFSTEF